MVANTTAGSNFRPPYLVCPMSDSTLDLSSRCQSFMSKIKVALEHQQFKFLYVLEDWRGVLEGRKWRGRVLEIWRRVMMTMGVG